MTNRQRRIGSALSMAAVLGVAALVLTLAVRSVGQVHLMQALRGRSLPSDWFSPVAEHALAESDGKGVVIVVRDGCSHCAVLLGRLDKALGGGFPGHLLVVGTASADRHELPRGAVLDATSRLAKELGITRTPVSLLVNRKRQIERVLVGDDASVEQLIVLHLHGQQAEKLQRGLDQGGAEQECASCRAE